MTEILDSFVETNGELDVRHTDQTDDATIAPTRSLTIVVPTKNEEANIEPLVSGLAAALATEGESVEVIFVDDSDDGTPARIRAVAAERRDGFAIQLIERIGREREGGLSGAVIVGIEAANSRWVCVMDGDMQHPPSVVSELLAKAKADNLELVVASRYCNEASNEGLHTKARKVISTACGRAARLSFSQRLAGVSDPMSGFFLVDSSKLDIERLRPRGFKILLEIIVSHPDLLISEVPFEFAPRLAGASKASTSQGVEFVRQLVTLRRGKKPSTWCYDVHGLIGVESDRALPELEKFLAMDLPDAQCIRVRVGPLRDLPLGESIDVRTETPSVGYRERSGFAMSLSVATETVEVTVSSFVARSPHVMYTNVVEPILRWRLVESGYALVHAACFADDDRAYLVTARTDTGKTTTMLKILDGADLAFVSDDLVIMSADGIVRSYPKPLTISAHTVHALNDTNLSRWERVVLVPQSRVHSREGRRLAFLLTKYRLPVASINALIQVVVPPPKYHVERLVQGVRSAERANVTGMFVIQRGGTGDETLAGDEALSTLLTNCDDAFGFPPYSSLERLLLSIASVDLRAAEREIIASALQSMPVRLMRSDSFDWATRIPRIIENWGVSENWGVIDKWEPASPPIGAAAAAS